LSPLKFGQPTPASVNNANDFEADTSFMGITFEGNSAFTLQGNRISLRGNVVNNSSQPQTIALDLQIDGATRTFNAATADIVIAGHLSGSQGLIKTGANQLLLKASNSYIGSTTINEGTLTLDGGDLADASTITMASGATLEVLSGTPTLGDISGQGTITVTGAGTVLTATSITADTLSIGLPAAASVPEPSAIVLLGIGIPALLLHLCRNCFGKLIAMPSAGKRKRKSQQSNSRPKADTHQHQPTQEQFPT
jgi:autotransporter-associated beta strand protein